MKKRSSYCGAVLILLSGSSLFLMSRERLDSDPKKYALAETKSVLGITGLDVEGWIQVNGKAPSPDMGLNVLKYDRGWPVDGWGRPLVYKQEDGVNSQKFKLSSVGPDGLDSNGQGDDMIYKPDEWH